MIINILFIIFFSISAIILALEGKSNQKEFKTIVPATVCNIQSENLRRNNRNQLHYKYTYDVKKQDGTIEKYYEKFYVPYPIFKLGEKTNVYINNKKNLAIYSKKYIYYYYIVAAMFGSLSIAWIMYLVW